MKANNFPRIFLLMISLGSMFYADAQQPKLCGTYKVDIVELNKALKFEKEHSLRKMQAGNISIRIYFHVFTYDDGSNAAATIPQINEEFNTLVAAYAADNICFLNAGVNYIHSSFLDTGFNADTDPPGDFTPYRVPDCINIFYSINIKGNNTACGCGIGGTAFTIPSTFCLIAQSNIGEGQTIAHEVGHCFGLLHTFETAYGYEDIDGSNSTSAGDLIADTPADPYAYRGKNCYILLGCSYIGSCKDPKNQSGFSPPYTNMMAYWWSLGCYPTLAVTGNQYTRINSFLSTNSGLEACESASSVNISNINITQGFYFQSAINTLTTGVNVNISGNTNSTLGGADVIINAGFHAMPSVGGIVLIRTDTCGPTGLNFANTGKENLSHSSAKLPGIKNENSLSAYPNPASSSVNLDFSLVHIENNLVIDVYDMNSKRVKRISLGSITPGSHTIRLNLNDLSPGIYQVVLQLSSLLLTTKVVLVK